MDAKVSAVLDASVKSSLDVTPKRSQIFVTVAMLGSILLAGFGCFLIYLDRDLWWAPFTFALLVISVSAWAFGISHRNAEMHNPIASELTMTPNEVRLITDPRLAEHSSFFSSMVDVFSALKNQKPLPYADALIDSQGQVITGSGEAARKATDIANDCAKKLIDETLAAFVSREEARALQSQPVPIMSDESSDFSHVGTGSVREVT